MADSSVGRRRGEARRGAVHGLYDFKGFELGGFEK
jgi:hypothetical protein